MSVSPFFRTGQLFIRIFHLRLLPSATVSLPPRNDAGLRRSRIVGQAKIWYFEVMAHTDQYRITLGDRGRLVLPASLRRRLSLQTGDRLILTVDPQGGFRIVSAREQARKLRGIFRDLAPGRSLVDELIAEHREEARREEDVE